MSVGFNLSRKMVAERVGFEPTVHCCTAVFKVAKSQPAFSFSTSLLANIIYINSEKLLQFCFNSYFSGGFIHKTAPVHIGLDKATFFQKVLTPAFLKSHIRFWLLQFLFCVFLFLYVFLFSFPFFLTSLRFAH